MRKQLGVSSVLAGFLCLLIVLSFFHESRGYVVPLKDLIKPQDVEYDIRVEFTGKLAEKDVKNEIKKLEEKYKLKVVRRANGKSFEFRLREKGDAGKVAGTIKKENKNVTKAEVNPLLTEFALQKIEKNKLKVTYKKHVKEYQKKYLEDFYKLKQAGKAKVLLDKRTEQVYEVSKVPLLKAYNGLRKVGIIKTVGFVGEEKIAEVLSGMDKLNLQDPEIKQRVISLAEKKYNKKPLTEEEKEFYKQLINQTVEISEEVRKKHPDIGSYWHKKEYFPRVIYVHFKKSLSLAEIRIFEKKYGMVVEEKYYDYAFTFLILNSDRTAVDMLYELKQDPDIQEVSLLAPLKKLTSPVRYVYNDPLFRNQWHLLQDNSATASNFDINAPEAWNITHGLRNEVVIAVIETYPFGDVDHEDLRGKMYTDSSGNIIGYNFMDNQNNFSGNTANYWFHGTEVMGVAAAETGNEPVPLGISGTAANSSIRIMPITFDVDRVPQLALALDFANQQFSTLGGVHVINMSFAGGVDPNLEVIRNAISRVANRAVLAAAAGNDSSDGAEYPADFPEVIKVAATQTDGLRWFDHPGEDGGSNYGQRTDLAAPGKEIVTTFWNSSQPRTHNLYTTSNPDSGTSLASPIVAGVAALVIAKYPNLTPNQVKRVSKWDGSILLT